MSEKKDLFAKAISVYQGRYKMEIPKLIEFVKERIDAPPDSLKLIEQEILKRHQGKEIFNEKEMRGYLHLIAAVQSKIDVRGRDINEL